MTNAIFIKHQETLGLTNRQLAEKIGADEGSISQWRKSRKIPDYIAGYLDLLVAVHINKITLPLSLGEVSALSKKADEAGCSIPDYIMRLILADIGEDIPAAYRRLDAARAAADMTRAGTVRYDHLPAHDVGGLNEEPSAPAKGAKSKPAA